MSFVQLRIAKKKLPRRGHVGIMCITDKQFGMMEIFRGHQAIETIPPPQ
jgi:CRISPR-associated protein Cas2